MQSKLSYEIRDQSLPKLHLRLLPCTGVWWKVLPQIFVSPNTKIWDCNQGREYMQLLRYNIFYYPSS